MCHPPDGRHTRKPNQPASARAAHLVSFLLVGLMVPNEQMQNAMFLAIGLKQCITRIPRCGLDSGFMFGCFPTHNLMRNIELKHPASHMRRLMRRIRTKPVIYRNSMN